MTVILFSNDEAESTNATTTWQNKISVTGSVRNVPHKVFVSCEYAGSATNRSCEVRVLLDGVERGAETILPNVAGAFRAFCSVGLITPAEGEHTIVLQFRAGATPQTVTIRRARILVEQH